MLLDPKHFNVDEELHKYCGGKLREDSFFGDFCLINFYNFDNISISTDIYFRKKF